MTISLEDWQEQAHLEVQAECDQNDPVIQNITYHRFVSRSKGIRNGKRRIRRGLKEVHLLSYRGGQFRQWHRFPFDTYATEIFGTQHSKEDAEEALRQAIINRWGF
jgi:hypothetical protein